MSIQANFVVLCQELDVGRIAPILRQVKMLTSDEFEELSNPAFTTRVKRERLLLYMPRKGSNHFERFAECLVWSGQEELARKIGVDVDRIPPRPANSMSSNVGFPQSCQLMVCVCLVPPPAPPQPADQGQMFAMFQQLIAQGNIGREGRRDGERGREREGEEERREREREKGREGGREREREGGREGRRKGGREGGKEEGREGRREAGRGGGGRKDLVIGCWLCCCRWHGPAHESTWR